MASALRGADSREGCRNMLSLIKGLVTRHSPTARALADARERHADDGAESARDDPPCDKLGAEVAKPPEDGLPRRPRRVASAHPAWAFPAPDRPVRASGVVPATCRVFEPCPNGWCTGCPACRSACQSPRQWARRLATATTPIRERANRFNGRR
jgi:hypothetical protein